METAVQVPGLIADPDIASLVDLVRIDFQHVQIGGTAWRINLKTRAPKRPHGPHVQGPHLPPPRMVAVIEPSMSKSERAPVLTIRSDEDIASQFDAKELRAIDYTTHFLTVFTSLCSSRTLTDEALLVWLHTTNRRKASLRLRYGRKAAALQALSSCGLAMSLLRKMYRRVVDERDPHEVRVTRPLKMAIEATVDDWEPMTPGQTGLGKRLRRICQKDSKFVATRNETRRTFFVTGKMGAGKTKSILDFCLEGLQKGAYDRVTYYGPRITLVQQVATNVSKMIADKSRTKGWRHPAKAVQVERFYSGAPVLWNAESDPPASQFNVACINSSHRLPEESDVMIVDEVATCMSNLLLNWSLKFHTFTGDLTSLNIHVDKLCIDNFALRIGRARNVFFVDAAFTEAMMNTCRDFRLCHEILKPPTERSPAVDRNMRAWLANIRRHKSQCEARRDQKTGEY